MRVSKWRFVAASGGQTAGCGTPFCNVVKKTPGQQGLNETEFGTSGDRTSAAPAGYPSAPRALCCPLGPCPSLRSWTASDQRHIQRLESKCSRIPRSSLVRLLTLSATPRPRISIRPTSDRDMPPRMRPAGLLTHVFPWDRKQVDLAARAAILEDHELLVLSSSVSSPPSPQLTARTMIPHLVHHPELLLSRDIAEDASGHSARLIRRRRERCAVRPARRDSRRWVQGRL